MIAFQKHYFRTIDSTNNEIKRLIAKKTISPGHLIYAGYQHQGKGAYQNRWESQAYQNLLLSFYIEPMFLKAQNQFQLSKAVSLAVADITEKILPLKEVSLKWPNDIYVAHNKLAGILIESAIRGQNMAYAVVGIGLNVNQTAFSDTIPNPTSLAIEQPKPLVLETVLEALEGMLMIRCKQLQFAPQIIDEEYKKRLYLRNKTAVFETQNTQFQGLIQRVDNFGRLQIFRLDKQQVQYFGFKEIKFIRQNQPT